MILLPAGSIGGGMLLFDQFAASVQLPFPVKLNVALQYIAALSLSQIWSHNAIVISLEEDDACSPILTTISFCEGAMLRICPFFPNPAIISKGACGA